MPCPIEAVRVRKCLINSVPRVLRFTRINDSPPYSPLSIGMSCLLQKLVVKQEVSSYTAKTRKDLVATCNTSFREKRHHRNHFHYSFASGMLIAWLLGKRTGESWARTLFNSSAEILCCLFLSGKVLVWFDKKDVILERIDASLLMNVYPTRAKGVFCDR